MFKNIVKYIESFFINKKDEYFSKNDDFIIKYSKRNNDNDIYIVSDYNINIIPLYNCDTLNLTITKCPQIKNLPDDLYKFKNIENITISHCDIQKIYNKLPQSLRYLEISYSGLLEIQPENTLENIAEINLTFNSLKEIPRFLNELIDNNPHIEIKLKGNDFWFTMYSDLTISMICPKTINELVYANKLNILSTYKLTYAVKILKEKKFTKEANWLAEQVDISLKKIKNEQPKNIYSNPQNVHLYSITDKTQQSIKLIMEYNINNHDIDIYQYINKFDKPVQDDINFHINNPIKHGIFGCTFYGLFIKVLLIARETEYFQSILFIINDELKSGLKTCLTGQMTRLVNSLSSFVNGISVTISKNEEISNSIIALRKRYAILYANNHELYINETIPAVWQLLEDECIPENEHDIWLEYV